MTKIVTKTTFVVGSGETVPPGTTVEIADDEAAALIDIGVAAPVASKSDASADTDKASKSK